MSDLFGLKIGFLFQKEVNFNNGLENLNTECLTSLSHYLRSVRFWTNQLVNDIWNSAKHSDWKLSAPDLRIIELPAVQVNLPRVFDTPVDLFALQTVNRCCLLVEDLIVYGFHFHRSSPILIMEIPKETRIYHQNKRFQAYPKFQGMTISDPLFSDDLSIQ